MEKGLKETVFGGARKGRREAAGRGVPAAGNKAWIGEAGDSTNQSVCSLLAMHPGKVPRSPSTAGDDRPPDCLINLKAILKERRPREGWGDNTGLRYLSCTWVALAPPLSIPYIPTPPPIPPGVIPKHSLVRPKPSDKEVGGD